MANNDSFFKVFMFLKLLRFLEYNGQVTLSLVKLVNRIADIFYLQRILFNNLMSWGLAAIKLILSIHVFSCIWVRIITLKQEEGVPTIEFEDDSIFTRYVSSIYLVATTISTVGYGDYKGFGDSSGSWAAEMTFLCLLQFVGILLFTIVTH